MDLRRRRDVGEAAITSNAGSSSAKAAELARIRALSWSENTSEGSCLKTTTRHETIVAISAGTHEIE
jgi:hypothetical protein